MNTTPSFPWHPQPQPPLVLVDRDNPPDVPTIRRMVLDRGHRWFSNGKRAYNLNIVGVRVPDPMWDTFSDWLMTVWPVVDAAGEKATDYSHFLTRFTTLPGEYYMVNRLLNDRGCAILKGGQYRGAYQIRKHRGQYDALCQDLAPVEYYRDKNRDKNWDLDPATVTSGRIGLNIHDSPDDAVTKRIGRWSAACQVVAGDKEFREARSIWYRARASWGNVFTYTLIDLLAESRAKAKDA